MRHVGRLGLVSAGLLLVLGACTLALDPFDALGRASKPETPVPTDGTPTAGDEQCVTLYAGQTIDVGSVCVGAVDTSGDGAGDALKVTYSTKNDWGLYEAHFWTGVDLADLPKTRTGNPVPGHFPYRFGDLEGVDSFSFGVPFDAALLDCDAADALLYAAAHAEVKRVLDDGTVESESAWGDGERITPRGNWATWFAVGGLCSSCGPIVGEILWASVPLDSLMNGDTVDFSVTATSGGLGTVVRYEVDPDYDGIAFNAAASSQDGLFPAVGPFEVECPCEDLPKTFTVAFRAIDDCEPATRTVFATAEVTVTRFVPPDPSGAVVLDAPVLQFNSTVTAVKVVGDYAYVRTAADLFIVDVSSPDAATIVGSAQFAYSGPGNWPGIDVAGDYAYLPGGVHGLHILDVRVPTVPTLVATVAVPAGYGAYGVHVVDGRAAVTDYGRYLSILNVESVDGASFIKAIQLSGSGVQVLSRRVQIRDGNAFVVCMDTFFAGLVVVDIESGNIVFSSSRFAGSDVRLSGVHAYVVNRSRGEVLIYDVGTAVSVQQVGTIPDAGRVAVHVYCGFAYGTTSRQLKVSRIDPLEEASVIGSLDFPESTLDVWVHRGHAYVAAGTELHVVRLW